MNRRALITLIGGAAAAPSILWPRAARAQQPALPVIGFLHSQSPDGFTEPLRGFRRGLKEAGFVEGDNVVIDYRWAENQTDRLPALAADLVRRGVAVIAAMGTPAVLQAKAATATIPIVFNIGDEPVRLGLVASLARPGGNVTGVNFLTTELGTKRLELLRELVPAAARVVVLVSPDLAEATLREIEPAARAMGLQIQVIRADSSRDLHAAFASFARERPDALFVGSGAFFTARRVQLVQLAARHAVPAIYPNRQNAEIGGLISYGASIANAWQQVGAYAGRLLKGAKPADLPVVQSSKFELVINADTARMLGLTVPPTLLSIADEVIE
jgi:ABC-type uncharacterized transport system substrate-binding protein